MKRRDFLRWHLAAVLNAAQMPVMGRDWLPDFNRIELTATGLNADQWRVLAAVQAHLFPSEEHAPGAKQANATSYLQWVLSDPQLQATTRELMRQGVQAVIAAAKAQYQQPFQHLHEARRERLLRHLEAHGQGPFLHELLYYILEALLTDPVYGGNPDAVGWTWLGHRPGYRRPTPDKRYFLL